MTQTLVNNRYILLDVVGKGGMGIVYRAYDRLERQEVALKHVAVDHPTASSATTILPPSNMTPGTALLKAIAQEFQVLASLRHPNIISVLDYGFDQTAYPYFTMELLRDSTPFVKTLIAQPLDVKVNFLVQILQALVYLHRRGIIHRDLKPDNVMIIQGQVKVLDFGLAVAHQQWDQEVHSLSGTITYIAPELLQGQPASTASDLYALGVIAYNLFANRHPFNLDQSAHHIINDILLSLPDYTPLTTVPEALRLVIERLLNKDPEARYQDAYAVIADLSYAIGQSLPAESVAVRESFLQASALVGREEELKLLRRSLYQATQKRGSAWLIGGESGVGKTRLMNEIRTSALIEDTIVLWVEGVQGADSLSQFWHDPLCRLLLEDSAISDVEAGILKEIVPQIDTLLERPVPAVPALVGFAHQRRLVTTVIEVIRRVASRKTLVLLFGDLQWAQASLPFLQAIIPLTETLPILFVGNYRQDESPHLSDDLPGCQVMKLARLDRQSIAMLARAMLGKAGSRPDIVEFLERETEGNAYFVVEVVRYLAEIAGQLNQIAEMDIPPQMTAMGGSHRVIMRRLEQVPQDARRLLKLAAIAGREVDLPLIEYLKQPATFALDQWLGVCSDAAVLEVQEGRWRFAHARLRDSLLVSLEEHERADLHRQVAEALETLYPNDQDRLAALAFHWYEARHLDKCAHYVRLAAQQAIRNCRYQLVLELTHLIPKKDALMYKLEGDAYEGLSDYAAASRAYATSLEQATDPREQVAALNGLGASSWRLANYAASIRYSQEALQLAEMVQDKAGIALSLSNLAICASDRGDFETAQGFYEKCLALRREIGDIQGVGYTLNSLGIATGDQGKDALAHNYFQQALEVVRQINDLHEVVFSLHGLAGVASNLGQHDAAITDAQEGLALARELGGQRGIALSLYRLGIAEGYRDNNLNHAREALQIAHKIGDRRLYANIAHDMGLVARYQRDYTTAFQLCTEAFKAREEFNDQHGIALSLAALGMLDYLDGKPEQAAQKYRQGLAIAQERHSQYPTVLLLVRLALIHMQQRAAQDAINRLDAALQIVRSADMPVALLQVGCAFALLSGNQVLLTHIQQHPAARNGTVQMLLHLTSVTVLDNPQAIDAQIAELIHLIYSLPDTF